MSRALERVCERKRFSADVDSLWNEAIRLAGRLPDERGEGLEGTPSERLRRLREMLEGELVAFHDALIVTPYEQNDT